MYQDHGSPGVKDDSTPESEAASTSGSLSLIESHVNFLLSLGVPGGRRSETLRKPADRGDAADGVALESRRELGKEGLQC
jgi:hypothetical protein